jgi:transcriptional regulator PpsR
MPDGFVVLDQDGQIQSANLAFLELVQVNSESAVIGQALDRWMRQPGAGPSALLAEVRRKGSARSHGAVIRGEGGRMTPVEISAGADAAAGNSGFIGVALRESASQCAADAAAQPLLASLEPAGNTPLKTLVQAAVEVVERHYVESALQITDGNRTAAAERLGLSRLSLYAKLNRYGIDGGSDVTSPPSD